MVVGALDLSNYFLEKINEAYEIKKLPDKYKEEVFNSISQWAFNLEYSFDGPDLKYDYFEEYMIIEWENCKIDTVELEDVKDRLEKVFDYICNPPIGLKIKHYKYFYNCINEIMASIDEDFKSYDEYDKRADDEV